LRTVKGDDTGCGWTASVHGRPDRDWSVGARFQSRVKLKLNGTVDLQSNPVPPNATAFSGGAAVELPASMTVGLVNRSVARLQLGVDVVWTEWSTYDELTYQFGQGYPRVPGVMANPEVNSKRWDDVWSIRLGGEYELTEAWVVRAGYVWDQSPVNGAARSPELPDSDRQMVMAGIGWMWENLQLDLAYAYLWAESARTGSEVVDKVPTLAGAYDTVSHLVGLSVGIRF